MQSIVTIDFLLYFPFFFLWLVAQYIQNKKQSFLRRVSYHKARSLSQISRASIGSCLHLEYLPLSLSILPQWSSLSKVTLRHCFPKEVQWKDAFKCIFCTKISQTCSNSTAIAADLSYCLREATRTGLFFTKPCIFISFRPTSFSEKGSQTLQNDCASALEMVISFFLLKKSLLLLLYPWYPLQSYIILLSSWYMRTAPHPSVDAFFFSLR